MRAAQPLRPRVPHLPAAVRVIVRALGARGCGVGLTERLRGMHMYSNLSHIKSSASADRNRVPRNIHESPPLNLSAIALSPGFRTRICSPRCPTATGCRSATTWCSRATRPPTSTGMGGGGGSLSFDTDGPSYGNSSDSGARWGVTVILFAHRALTEPGTPLPTAVCWWWCCAGRSTWPCT